ncbi:MAG: hypothetical protein QM589_01195 [Thermomicrobiales bacterium]
MDRCSRRTIVTSALGAAAAPRLAAALAQGEDPRDAETAVETVLGQHVAWEDPWFLKVHQPLPDYAESVILDSPHARFAFVLHDTTDLSSEYWSPRYYRDTLIEDPERWNIDILSVFSDQHGYQAVVVGQTTDRVYYYCVMATDSQFLLELGLYAKLDRFAESWDLAAAITLDGLSVFAGFDEVKILGPVVKRANASSVMAPGDVERTYLVAMWRFYDEMSTSTAEVQAARTEAGSEDDAIAAIEPYVDSWRTSIRSMQAVEVPSPDFARLDTSAQDAAGAYALAAERYEGIAATGEAAQSIAWAGFLIELATAGDLLQQMKQELDRWEIPSVNA